MDNFNKIYNQIIAESKTNSNNKKYIVIYTPESGNIKTFGPFDSKKEAKEWMANDFNENYKVAKDTNTDVKWNWTEAGTCHIKGIGNWEIVEFFGKR